MRSSLRIATWPGAMAFLALVFASETGRAGNPATASSHTAADSGTVADAETPWAFSPPRRIVPPQVAIAGNEAGDSRAIHGIDAFISAKLDGAGLRGAPPARRAELLRRVTFDLIGLPPTPAEIESFLNDEDPRAYRKVVDRLLDDPRYGERWARLWLDLARYADTAGHEGDPDLPHAWRYRDYVIDAFNNDKPYDQFIREQIAGDEFNEIMGAGDLPQPKPEHMVALTFLRLAPFTEPRGDETRHEMLSEMTSTVGSVFLGLTIGCAKCHDHKYDRIPTKDFYRMKAFFSTIQIPRPEPGDIYQIGGPTPVAFYRDGEAEWVKRERGRLDEEIAASKQELESFRADVSKRVETPTAGFGLQAITPNNNYVFDTTPVADGKLHVALVNADGDWKFFTDDSGPNSEGSLSGSDQGEWFADIPDPRTVSLGQHTTGTGVPAGNAYEGRFAEILIYDRPLDADRRRHLSAYVLGKYQSGDIDTPPAPPADGLQFWLDAADLDADPETNNPPPGHQVAAWIDKVSRITLYQDDPERQPALDVLGESKAPAVRFANSFLAGDVRTAPFLNDKRGAIVVVFATSKQGEGYGLEVGGNGALLTTFINPDAGGIDLEKTIRTSPRVSDAERARYAYLKTRPRFIAQHRKRLQPLAMTLRHSYGPPFEPGVPTTRVMVRGEYDNPGDVVEAGFLSCITGHQQPAPIRLDPFKRWPTRSRHMALAKWIASEENPLTARVMVNRLWHWHFGRGIVATPSDFGQLSGGPSHPDLLDWLANEFVASNWSIKAMHRMMVLSRTYRQSCEPADAVAVAHIDPDNRLLAHFRRRRLEAEQLRDSVLAVSGRLDPEQFGPPVFPPLPGGIDESVKYTENKWDTQRGRKGRKRSIYIYQQRTLTMPLMQAFDSLVCDESRPRRRSSTTPLQALAMYNGNFVNEEAVHFARRVRSEAGADPTAQIERAVLLAFGRQVSAAERDRFAEFLAEGESPEAALTAVCRILYNANEFVYVD